MVECSFMNYVVEGSNPVVAIKYLVKETYRPLLA